jgi:hypothetical protein
MENNPRFIDDAVFESCDKARICLTEAIKATSNLPKGLNRGQVIAAFMEVAAKVFVEGKIDAN